ncbi:MAG: hypothetical protein IID14_00540 [Candidatus Marinimicrobia bacterium]|nr:hypothetical protein [Candidatus Neomarinimicrobiota bacterium]
MISAVYQLSLVISMAVLAVLLLRGYTLFSALTRSAVVLVAVLFLLIIAGNILRWSLHARQMTSENMQQTAEPVEENETSDNDSES